MKTVLGGEERECEHCNGLGYIEVGSTSDPEENEFLECEPCEGSGVVYQEEIIPF
jgi:DnaJ-class molecular chaperone